MCLVVLLLGLDISCASTTTCAYKFMIIIFIQIVNFRSTSGFFLLSAARRESAMRSILTLSKVYRGEALQ